MRELGVRAEVEVSGAAGRRFSERLGWAGLTAAVLEYGSAFRSEGVLRTAGHVCLNSYKSELTWQRYSVLFSYVP